MKHFNILTMSLLSSTSVFGVHPVKFETQVLAVDANEGVAVADFDKDGKLDGLSRSKLVPEPGKSGAWVQDLCDYEDKGGYAHSNGEHAYDVDGDGWIDAVSNSFWLPEGTGTETRGRRV